MFMSFTHDLVRYIISELLLKKMFSTYRHHHRSLGGYLFKIILPINCYFIYQKKKKKKKKKT